MAMTTTIMKVIIYPNSAIDQCPECIHHRIFPNYIMFHKHIYCDCALDCMQFQVIIICNMDTKINALLLNIKVLLQSHKVCDHDSVKAMQSESSN